MNLAALQHLLRAAQALAENQSILVLGSASLLASFPELGNADGPLTSTFDADLCPDPFDEITAIMLDEALGENRAYYLRHGYHADILRSSILETLPQGWRGRLVPVPGTMAAHALDPHDLAAVKLLVGRQKDLAILKTLRDSKLIEAPVIAERLKLLDIPVEFQPRLQASYRSIFNS